MLSFSMFPWFPSFLRLSPNVLPKFLRVSYCSDLLTFLQREINIIFKVRKCWTFKAKSGGGLHYYSFLMLQRILPAGPWAPISDPLAPKQKYSAVVAHSALRTSARLEWMFRGDWLACSQTCLGDPKTSVLLLSTLVRSQDTPQSCTPRIAGAMISPACLHTSTSKQVQIC